MPETKVSDLLTDYKKVMRLINQKKLEKAELQGKNNQLLEVLKSEFDVNTLDAAIELKADLKADLKDCQGELEDLLDAIYDIIGD